MGDSVLYDSFGSDFDSSKYFKNNKISVGPNEIETSFVDGSDAYANLNKLFVSFHHVPTQRSVFFKAFITAFNETYSSEWSSESVYGRADPIYMFKQTQRKITLAIKIPASSTGEAYENLGKVQSLVQFLYPNYTEVQNAASVSQSPLIRLKIMNLIKNTNDEFSPGAYKTAAAARRAAKEADELSTYSLNQTWGSSDGLLGVIENLTVNHNLEGEDGAFVVGTSALLPKFLDINLSFAPIHEHPLGWDESGIFAGDPWNTRTQAADSPLSQRLFPYGVKLKDPDELYSENAAADASAAAIAAGGYSVSDDREAAEAAAANAEAMYGGIIKSITGNSAETPVVDPYPDTSSAISDMLAQENENVQQGDISGLTFSKE
jgi:hypothetical protein